MGAELGSESDVFKVLLDGRRQKATVTRKQFTFQDDIQLEPEVIAAAPAKSQGKGRKWTKDPKGKAQRAKGGGGKRGNVSPAHSAGKRGGSFARPRGQRKKSGSDQLRKLAHNGARP